MAVTKRFGILTAGGDCPGLNAAIRGVCRAAHGCYGMEIVGIANGFRGLIDKDAKILKPEDFSGILNRGGTILGSSREKPFNAGTTERNYEITDKVLAIKDTYSKLELDCLVVIGGNGTNTTGYRLSLEGLNVIGLPKTIDNDIVGTDKTFGFDSALDICTEAIDRLHPTAQSHSRVMVIELMGNKAGWLALYAGVAGGGDVILLPEIPYDIRVIAHHLKERAKSGKTFSIVVAAEGVMSIEESEMEKKERKTYRLEKGPSAGYRIAREIEEFTGMEVRATVLGHVQRGGTPSAADRVLATGFGAAAAELLAKGEYNKMIVSQNNKICSVDLSIPEGKVKFVPDNHYMLDTAKIIGTCFGI